MILWNLSLQPTPDHPHFPSVDMWRARSGRWDAAPPETGRGGIASLAESSKLAAPRLGLSEVPQKPPSGMVHRLSLVAPLDFH